MLHCKEIPVPEVSDLPDISIKYDEFRTEVESFASDSGGSVFKSSSSITEQFKQEELSDLVRDLNLSKETEEILASGSKTKTSQNWSLNYIPPYKRKKITSVFEQTRRTL